ncbi:hypothetical protein SDC9_139070 [bioreactor metagenome]|uniref:Uncharacterized protein n=1 Tax=bioreactor metagenome TaxID=1076179 RepID=A0A645DRJ2_9ZZZZ
MGQTTPIFRVSTAGASSAAAASVVVSAAAVSVVAGAAVQATRAITMHRTSARESNFFIVFLLEFCLIIQTAHKTPFA